MCKGERGIAMDRMYEILVELEKVYVKMDQKKTYEQFMMYMEQCDVLRGEWDRLKALHSVTISEGADLIMRAKAAVKEEPKAEPKAATKKAKKSNQ